ncbi:MAG: class I SAM-dependent methyltransferase [Planctomycetota bacterium]|jgi:cyclopropane fatty-acyl-phospholipid synthase-like methyltransferase
MKEKYDKKYYTSGNYENYLKRKFQDLATDISNEISLTPDKEVIDFGCGYGGLLEELWNMGFDKLYGTDISMWVIDYGKLKFPHIEDKLYYHNMNCLTKRFDHLFLLDVLEHMPETDIEEILHLANIREFLIIRIPVSAHEGEKYVLDISNRDTTHICCHTRDWWIDFFDNNGYKFKGDIKRSSIYSSDGVLSGKWIKREPVLEGGIAK